jgi:methyltransferase family protein
MKEFWDLRYKADDYAYGIEPNVFFKETLDEYNPKGKILLPAEGEGRNAVYAAKKGMEVYAFDISIEGKNKADQLAKREGVNINYEVGEFSNLNLLKEKYDVAALIFAHFPPNILTDYHRKIASLIKPNGIIILEGFSKNNLEIRQNNPSVGGPDNLNMLFSIQEIQQDFSEFEIIVLEEKEFEFKEGKFHNGIGKVIRFIGKKTV